MLFTLIISVTLSVAISATCSLLESVLYSTRRLTLEAERGQNASLTQRMLAFKDRVDRPLAGILILNTVANTAGAALAGWAAGQVWGPHSLWIFSISFTACILVFSEILPKTMGAVYWRPLWPFTVWPLTGLIWLLSPIITLTRGLTNLVTRGKDQKVTVSEEEILAAARLGASGGEISTLESELIRNIIHLEEKYAADIMTPRTVLLAVDGSRPLGEVRGEARDWPFSRVPVYQGETDQVKGYLLKYDILTSEKLDQESPVGRLAKPVHFVPATANLLNLLSSFLRRRQHMYMVVDEYGGVMGLLTLEDVLETLVGSEIVDENDQVEDMQKMARLRGRDKLRGQEGEGI
jgi:CBS domain containing-hemolysin-like protein